MEVISQTHIQPTRQLQPRLQPNRLRGNHSQPVILHSVYTKHMWHLKTFRKQTSKSSFLSPPCLDGAPAFPNSESAPRKRVMPWDGGKQGSREGGEEQVLGWPPGPARKGRSRHLCPRRGHVCAPTCHSTERQPALKWPPRTAADSLLDVLEVYRAGRSCYRQLGSAALSSEYFYWRHRLKSLPLVFQWSTNFFK